MPISQDELGDSGVPILVGDREVASYDQEDDFTDAIREVTEQEGVTKFDLYTYHETGGRCRVESRDDFPDTLEGIEKVKIRPTMDSASA